MGERISNRPFWWLKFWRVTVPRLHAGITNPLIKFLAGRRSVVMNVTIHERGITNHGARHGLNLYHNAEFPFMNGDAG